MPLVTLVPSSTPSAPSKRKRIAKSSAFGFNSTGPNAFVAGAKRELAEAANGYDLALRAASAELSRACKAAADKFGPRMDRARSEIDRLCGT